ncbi:Palmitoylated plasma membrane-bound casein kinase [Entomophthora muscae]|uniref:Palmitoylated plasma membrane-bound casein kinase n=1 Tax=Entomophthora muscae TaxID=34485 RepID=A0ACC2UK15_9FUNG|nr:Palmitoylated plasma membrane-bound casein kinase [Entomophthora muscae]
MLVYPLVCLFLNPYLGTNLLNNQSVAIKFEPRKADVPQLRDEYRAYRILAGLPGIPSAYYFGQEGLYNVLCIDILGPSLEDLFDICRRKFSVKTVALLAKQMITRVQSVHEKSLIYRDIKPDNFLMGKPHSKHANVVHMVDFGMVKQYRDPKTKQHIPYRERKSLSGTARYMSINTHLGREQSRRDDLEALGHVFMYFLRGSLPWQGLKAANNKQKYDKISETKQLTQIKDLCGGFPEEFTTYMNYTRKMAFEETPDYDYLRGLMDNVLKKLGIREEDEVFDWMLQVDQIKTPSHSSFKVTENHPEAATRQTLHGSRANITSRMGEGLGDSRTQNELSLMAPSGGVNSHLRNTSGVNTPGQNAETDAQQVPSSSHPEMTAAPTDAPPKEAKEKRGGLNKLINLITCRSCYS